MQVLDACSTALRGVAREGEVLLVHHWDADGVAAAALLSRVLESSVAGLVVPRIGWYSLEAVASKLGRWSGPLVVLDYGVPGRVYDGLAELVERLYVFDHHRVEPPSKVELFCNPVAAGLADERSCPSTAWLLWTLTGRPLEHQDLALLGVVGDVGFMLSEMPELEAEVRELLSRLGLTLRQALRAVVLVDSCYHLLDEDCVAHAVEVAASEGVRGLLEDDRLWRARERVVYLVEKGLSELTLMHFSEVAEVYSLTLDAYVTSAVGRRLASRYPGKVVVLVHYIPSMGKTVVYARSIRRRLEGVRRKLQELGIAAGGKDYVLVVEQEGPPSPLLVDRVVEAVEAAAED